MQQQNAKKYLKKKKSTEWFYDVYNAICVFDMTFLLHIYLHAIAFCAPLYPTNFLFKQTNNRTSTAHSAEE